MTVTKDLCIHELDRQSCTFCVSRAGFGPRRPRQLVLSDELAMPSVIQARMQAQHTSTCLGCGERIFTGDEIVLIDGVWVCAACGETE